MVTIKSLELLPQASKLNCLMCWLSCFWFLNIMYQLLLKEEPLSLNHADKERKDEYRKRLHALIDARYDLEGKKVRLDRSHRYYLLVAYLFKGKKERDIDNILKVYSRCFLKYIKQHR